MFRWDVWWELPVRTDREVEEVCAMDLVDGSATSDLRRAARCVQCGLLLVGLPTPSGHLIGAHYRSACHHMTYRVDGTATLWEFELAAATRRRWDNGNTTVSAAVRGEDEALCAS